jgi:hypothetical protein
MGRFRFRNKKVIAPRVGGIFFPMRERLGFDARLLTPLVVRKMTVIAAETRSYKRAVIALREADVFTSTNTVERVVLDVGAELTQRRDAPKSPLPLANRPENVPKLAVVECDGGRIRTREPGHGPGVTLSGKGWNETKNACLIRADHKTFDEDPKPDPPACFLDHKHVAKIAETEALSVAAPIPKDDPPSEEDKADELVPPADWAPKRQVRTVLSSMASSKIFGRQMKREAQQRRFFEADAKAFLGDGLPWNWSIWKQNFPEFTPILDFIHVLSYLFLAAKAVHQESQDAWDQYCVWMTGCWRGEVNQVLEELAAWQERLGLPPEDASSTDPRAIITTTLRYLTNNRDRMKYDEYRRAGLPITTAWMESLVKEINYRVKGTEMFWNNPEGAEAILQVRAAALCDDARLSNHLENRPGSPFTRKPKSTKLQKEKIKS